jgi:hypothetical protein
MADERPFNEYFANRTVLPGDVLIANDELLVLRGSTVYRHPGAALFAYAALSGGTDTTTITTIDVWVPIEGTLVEGAASTNFSFAANEYTYVGPNQSGPQLLKAKMSLFRAGGGGEDAYEVGVFVNGSLVGTGMTTGASANIVGFAATENFHSLQTSDIIDMRVRNTTSANDCIITSAQLIIG